MSDFLAVRSVLASKQLPAWNIRTSTLVGHETQGELGGDSLRSMLDELPKVGRRLLRSDATRCKYVWLKMLSSADFFCVAGGGLSSSSGSNSNELHFASDIDSLISVKIFAMNMINEYLFCMRKSLN